jgi:hypothetical protein
MENLNDVVRNENNRTSVQNYDTLVIGIIQMFWPSAASDLVSLRSS